MPNNRKRIRAKFGKKIGSNPRFFFEGAKARDQRDVGYLKGDLKAVGESPFVDPFSAD